MEKTKNYFKKKQSRLDEDTKQYILKIRIVQLCVFVVMIGAFVWLGYCAVSNSSQSLREVAVAEVEEAMRETVNNTIIQIDLICVRKQEEMEIHIEEIADRIGKNGISEINDLISCNIPYGKGSPFRLLRTNRAIPL